MECATGPRANRPELLLKAASASAPNSSTGPTVARHVYYLPMDAAEAGDDFGIPSAETGSYPVRPGNSVRLLVDGEPSFRRICEAIEAAHHSVWATVTFMWADFRMPDARGSALDVLNRAASRGVDVRLLFWRPDAETEVLKRNAFWGSAQQLALLKASHCAVRIRWDRAQPGYCQHQKSWLIDAGEENTTAFVGGINLNPHSMVLPGHRGERQNHDVYLELTGPSVVDVHHNFVQRWNEASERLGPDGRWGEGSETSLPFPVHVPGHRGAAAVQIQRTIHPGRYADRRSTPKGLSFDIASGERSILEQYCSAISSARRSLYIENHTIDVPEITAHLHQAVRRGVEVVLVLPAEMDLSDNLAASSKRLALVREWRALSSYENFTLAGLAGLGMDRRRKPVYVHSKIMLVDDLWATVGSCNLHRFSLFGNSELNAAIWDPEAVRAMRSELLLEHLNLDTSHLDGRAALQLFRRIALQNRGRLEQGDQEWEGLAFAL